MYPLFFINIFDVDWKVPLDITKGQYYYVSEYARMEVTQPFNEYINHNYPWRVWFPVWFERVWGLLIGKVIILTLPFSILLYFYYIFLSKKQWKLQNLNYLILSGILIFATVIWFIRAPAIRFVWGWILVLLILSFGLIVKNLILENSKILKSGIIMIVFLSLIRSSIASIIEFPNFTNHLLYPVAVNNGQIHSVKNWNEIIIKIAEDNFCHGIAPPCLPRHYHPNLMLRGNELSKGFKIEGK